MTLRREQIGRDRRWVNLAGKWLKRQFSRWRRRQEKRDPENAPKRDEYKGHAG